MSSRGTRTQLVYSVTLRKQYSGFGTARKGDVFRAVFRQGHQHDEAVRLAYRTLKRDKPNENPMAWDVTDG